MLGETGVLDGLHLYIRSNNELDTQIHIHLTIPTSIIIVAHTTISVLFAAHGSSLPLDATLSITCARVGRFARIAFPAAVDLL